MRCASCAIDVTPSNSTAMIVRNIPFADVRLCADCHARFRERGWIPDEEKEEKEKKEKKEDIKKG